MIKLTVKIILIFSLVFLVNTMFFNPSSAIFISSDNYTIESDDASITGGQWASTNYIFRDTLGEVSTGLSNSTSYKMKAGWQEMLESYLTVSAPNDIALTPSIPGVSGGTATGEITWTVIADGSAGFSVDLSASTDPAMILSGDPTYYFDDYTPSAGGVPDYNWSIGAGDAEFGFTVEPETAEDAVQKFLDNGVDSCNTGSTQTAGKCWFDFNGTADISIINRPSRTDNDGEDELISFQGQSSAKLLKDGDYTATITTTVYSN